jgi:DNA-binding transcriptional LysR family regulator
VRHVDLNLLRLLDSLMTERSATRAGERLGISQSAVSHGLRRLRDLLDDPLFVRGPNGLEPTERMNQIAPKLKSGLTMLRESLSDPDFDPATSTRCFMIAAVSYVCATLIPHLIARIEQLAPHVEVKILGLPETLSGPIKSRAIDLAIGSFEQLPQSLNAEILYEDRSVWVVNAGHPLAGSRPTLGELMAARQVVVNAAADMAGVRGRIQSGGVKTRVAVDLDEHFGMAEAHFEQGLVTVYDVRTALDIAATSPFAAMVPLRLAQSAVENMGLVMIEPPATPQPIPISMIWHRDLGDDPALIWLRDVIAATARALPPLRP